MTRLFYMFLLIGIGYGCQAQSKLMRVADVMALPVRPPIAQLAYGSDSLQFGELYLPTARNAPYPVVILLHGGCWLSAYDLHLMDAMATQLSLDGFAVWNLEYRRVGDREGGWPNTFLDVAAGVDHLRQLAEDYPLDLDHVVVVGHSAGGHLALWTAQRDQLPVESEISSADPLPLSGVVSLAGIVDPASYLVREGQACGASVDELIGGLPETAPNRYRDASPLAMSPLGVRQVLISGTADQIVPLSHIQPYVQRARQTRDRVKLVNVPDAGHFEVIAPGSIAWPAITKAIRRLARKRSW